MADVQTYDPLALPKLGVADVRRVQRALTRTAGVKIAADGILGPQTARAAFDFLREGAQRLSHEEFGLLEAVAAGDQRAFGDDWRRGLVWTFYSNDPGSESWLEGLGAGDTIFWIHGRHGRGGNYRRQLRAGDTVLLLVGDAFVASGVLLADERLHFIDQRGRVRRPVRVLQRYPEPVPRQALQDALKLEPLNQGAVHPLSADALSWLNERLSNGPRLPYPVTTVREVLGGQPLTLDLQREAGDESRYIRPDAATAEAIGWTGPTWTPEDLPSPAKTASSSGDDVQDGAGNVIDEPDEPSDEPEIDSQIPYVLDAPSDAEDQLDRGPYALFLARRLHLIWCQINGCAPGSDGKPTKASPPDADTFILHVDAPWGGGKTTFANFLAKVLDPRGQTLTPGHFLRSTLGATKTREELKAIELGDVFAPNYAKDAPDQWPDALRPWIVARYNAWRDQYVQPPWWQIFLTLHEAVRQEAWRDAWADLRQGRVLSGLRGVLQWAGIRLERRAYELGNSKLRAAIIPWLIVGALCLALWLNRLPVAEALLKATAGPNPSADMAKRASEWIGLLTAFLGLGGASLSTLFAVLGQSISPDLDFTAEHKHIGVHDPIRRFRRSFHKILAGTRRPILLIVDDLDRCDPKTVVEILRGFQTIIRSPRLFVLLLGDRTWIETAHDVYHKDLAGLRSAEGTLGSLYVQKVIQLSFRLPTMNADARRRFARTVLGERLDETAAGDVADALRTAEAKSDESAAESGSVADREASAEAVVNTAVGALPDTLTPQQRDAAIVAIKDIVTAKVVAASGSDAAQQREVFNIVTQLFDCLPNNPRQIKRIFMAFATYEPVGRKLFQYQLTPVGEDGERLARRWRQLALWVTLAVEWPDTWRAIAKRPEVLDVAYAAGSQRAALDSALTSGMTEQQRNETIALLHRLRTGPTLRALLGGAMRDDLGAEANRFANTTVETQAVYEFNRIIWEPGFVLEPEVVEPT